MATLQELQQALVKADAAGNQADAKAFADAIREVQANNPTKDMSVGELLAAGAGKAVADTGLGVRQLGGTVMDYLRPRQGQPSRSDILRQEVEETRRRDAPLMDTAAGMIGNIGGNVATALLPGGISVQAGKQIGKIPGAFKLAQALQTGGKAIMAPKSILGALGVGAAQGALQPSTSTGETLANAALGAGASALVPAAIRGAQVGKAFIDPLSQTGQQQIVGRALTQAAGSPESAAAARAGLQAATAPFVGPVPEGEIARQMMGEIVPGAVPTTAQAAGVPSIAALSRSASAVDPASTNALAQRLAEQNAARFRQVEDIAGSTGGRDFAAANRQVVGNEMYEAARRQGINPAALTPESQANMAQFQQRIPPEILASAQKLARIEGVPLDNASSVQGMHWVKRAIDGEIEAAKRAGNSDLARAYTGLQTDLLSGLDELSPAYGEARRTFAQMSKPINEMDVAQEILNKSSSALPRAVENPALAVPTIRPEAFARALSDKTASNVVRPGATLEGVMQPRNLQKLQNVQEDLARANFANTAGKEAGGSDTAQKLAYSNLMTESGLPNWLQALGGRTGAGGLAQKTGQIIYRDANQEMSQKLAQALLDPQIAAQLMEAGIVNPQLAQSLNAARRIGSGGGAMTPALLNSVAPQELYLGQ